MRVEELRAGDLVYVHRPSTPGATVAWDDGYGVLVGEPLLVHLVSEFGSGHVAKVLHELHGEAWLDVAWLSWCRCDVLALVQRGCRCGGIQLERERTS